MEDQATSLGVMVFPPGGENSPAARPFWTYATNGLSERRMPCRVPPHGDPADRLELLAYTLSYAEWVERLLAELAAYPFVHGSGLAIGHTLPVQPGAENPWHGYLITQPRHEGPEFNPLAIDIGFDDWVSYGQVVGLHAPSSKSRSPLAVPRFESAIWQNRLPSTSSTSTSYGRISSKRAAGSPLRRTTAQPGVQPDGRLRARGLTP